MLGILFRNLKKLPRPLGQNIVGIKQLDFADHSRTQVFPFEEDNAHRKIPVTIFYPAESDGGKDSAPYSSPEVLEVLSEMTFGLISKNVAKVKTNCYENVPIAVNEDKYPVIIFNHGYGGYTMQSTVLCFEKYLLGNQEIELQNLKYDGVEFRQKLSKKQKKRIVTNLPIK